MMTSKTKHRILGLLVIAGLIIIAIPLFQQHQNASMKNPLNEKPPFPDQTVQVQSMEQHEQTAQQVEPEASSLASASLSADNKLEAVTGEQTDQVIVPVSGWVVQLGSFKKKENALRLVNQLRAEGYHAFFNSNHDTLTRVFIGPEFKKSDASLLADQVNKKIHLQGIIVNYKSLTL